MTAMPLHPLAGGRRRPRARAHGAALLLAALSGFHSSAQAQNPSGASPLPAPVQQALRQAQIPEQALGVWLQPVDGGAPRLQWQADKAFNPASLLKLVTGLAALEQLGPAWTWQTPVWMQGRFQPETGRLTGDLVIKGVGDPKLVRERLWLLLQRLRGLGLREIEGDIVLDGSAFAPWPGGPADFDGEPWRPGNATPEALLLNHKALIFGFRPDTARGIAHISADPPLPGLPQSVPLASGPCNDWRGGLRLLWQEGQPLRFAGTYPTSCGELSWPLADPEPASYNARLLRAQWLELGGSLRGQVRAGTAPADSPPLFSFASPPLAEVLRDILKHSANLGAEMLLLSLARERPATLEGAREQLRRWLVQRLGEDEEIWLENGSGLSRQSRLKPRQLGLLLRQAWAGPQMPEFVSALPIAGQDGTLTRGGALRYGPAYGRAHLKTGSLRDVTALAGYVHADSGRRYVMVAMLQHPRAAAGRPALDALLQWAVQDAP